MTVALALLPDFALILLGAAIRRGFHLGDHFWTGLEKLVYFVLFPALLFNGLVRTRIDWIATGPLVLTAASAMGGAMLLGFGARWLGMTPRNFAAQHQCSFRFNSYIGLAIAGNLHGAAGIAAMAIVVGTMVTPANFAAVWMLARHGEQSVWRELAKNPLILATLAGLTANLLGFEAPEVMQKFLQRLADASIALGLITVGAGLRWVKVGVGSMKSLFGTASWTAHLGSVYILAVKLIALPLIAIGVSRCFGLPPLYASIALIFAALPTASSAFILAQRMGYDGTSVAWLISASTLLAMISLPLWLGLT
jgi:predicted permease